jgi:endonuclease/exonuclease/phosphatase family metal-dependent hydrolase
MKAHRTPMGLLCLPLVLLAAAPLAAAPPDQAAGPANVTVMTRNVYLGADLAPVIFAAVTGGDIVAATTQVWAGVRFTDFPARAESLAREIAAAGPDLIGVQEAELWRSQTPADFIPGNADHVEYDFVQILLDRLAARGLHYALAAEHTGVDVELPGLLSESATELSDIRLTERDVILARTDCGPSDLTLSNPQTGHFVTNVEYPTDFGTLTVLRGWASVDATVRGRQFRFVSTHLEADSEDVRVAQALEIITGPANTSLPVVFVADSNSNANGDSTSGAYFAFLGAGFADAWAAAHPGSIVSTCCNAPLLTNPVFPLSTDDEGRIDLVLARGGSLRVQSAHLYGTNRGDRVWNGVTRIWPSDHAGVAARLQLLR